MKKMMSTLLVAAMLLSLGCGAFAAETAETAADETAAASDAAATEEDAAAAEDAAAEDAAAAEDVAAATEETAAEDAAAVETSSAEEETVAAEETAEDAAAEDAAAEDAAAVETSAEERTVAAEETAEDAAAAEETEEAGFIRNPDKALITFDVNGTTYYSQVDYGSSLSLYPEIPASITDENGAELVFNCWLTDESVPFYPDDAVDADLNLTAHYAFASFSPEYVFLAGDVKNNKYEVDGRFSNVLINLPDGETRTAEDLTWETGDYNLVKVVEQADGNARVYGALPFNAAPIDNSYITVTDAVSGTTAYVTTVIYQPLGWSGVAPQLPVWAE